MIHFLHGFLGTKNEWNIKENIPNVYNHGLYDLVLNPHARQALAHSITLPATFIGYSMGGRFWPSFLLSHHILPEKIILISAHYGLQNLEQRKNRKNFEQQILQKLAHSATSEFLHFWNNLPLFAFDQHKDTLPNESRQTLIDTFEKMQLSLMDNVLDWLKNLGPRVHFIYGKYDKTYANLAQHLKSLGIKTYEIEGGHRLIGNPKLNTLLSHILELPHLFGVH